MNIKNVTVAGGGVLGSQIAFQTAYTGHTVKVWVLNNEIADDTLNKLAKLKETYMDTINKMDTEEGKSFNIWARGLADTDTFNKNECIKKAEDAFNNIKIITDLKEAVNLSDLVIESIIEDEKIKIDFYKKLSHLLGSETLIVTNSSTMLPSTFAKYTGRKDKFLALHFANSIWKNNTAEVMAHNDTSKESFNTIMEFAKSINMIALPIYKEKSGYLLNSMLIPLLFSGLDLLVNGISDVESIDKAWTLGAGAPKGPFQILDTVGLNTAYNIVSMYTNIPSFLAPYNFKGMQKLLKSYIDQNKLGMSTGEGFYKYN